MTNLTQTEAFKFTNWHITNLIFLELLSDAALIIVSDVGFKWVNFKPNLGSFNFS